MRISRRSAMQIVEEISAVINQHVNMMDASGIIIASTDPARVGLFHGGAAHVIAQQLEELIIKEDGEYGGSKKGINLPILFQGEVIGVIGITGEREKVVKYGQIIKKMTEILLRDSYAKEQVSIDARIRDRFLDEWVFGEMGNINQPFIERGRRLGIDITLPRRVLLAALANRNDYGDSSSAQRTLDKIYKTVKKLVEEDKNSILLQTSAQLVLLVPDCTDEQLSALADRIEKKLDTEFNAHLQIGMDSRGAAGFAFLHSAYLKAQKALRACKATPGRAKMFYADIGIEIFMGELPKALQAEFVRRIFRSCTPEDISGWVPLLQAFFDANGSIGLTAQRLFMHKNTLQYKLKKLHTITGYDPRVINHCALLYIAVQFYNDGREELLSQFD